MKFLIGLEYTLGRYCSAFLALTIHHTGKNCGELADEGRDEWCDACSSTPDWRRAQRPNTPQDERSRLREADPRQVVRRSIPGPRRPADDF
jgi:hypothetical protein